MKVMWFNPEGSVELKEKIIKKYIARIEIDVDKIFIDYWMGKGFYQRESRILGLPPVGQVLKKGRKFKNSWFEYFTKWWESEGYQQLNFLQSQLTDTITLPIKEVILTESFLREKYLNEGLSSAEIAAISFSSRETVTRKLKELQIPLKKVTRRETGSQAFGYRKYGGRSVEVKSDQAVIKLINLYRQQGYSYQRVADLLNDQNVKTKLRQGFWYSKVVRQIFIRSTIPLAQ
ncbi:MAG: hypothetical protein ACOVP4_04780 [Bacteriovoracaceae bacterium]